MAIGFNACLNHPWIPDSGNRNHTKGTDPREWNNVQPQPVFLDILWPQFRTHNSFPALPTPATAFWPFAISAECTWAHLSRTYTCPPTASNAELGCSAAPTASYLLLPRLCLPLPLWMLHTTPLCGLLFSSQPFLTQDSLVLFFAFSLWLFQPAQLSRKLSFDSLFPSETTYITTHCHPEKWKEQVHGSERSALS